MKINRSLKVGLIGTGLISHDHALGYKLIPDLDFTAVADIRYEVAKDFARQYGVKDVFKDYRNLLKREDLDFVVICVPVNLHMEMTVAAAEAGKHVLCEKPIALNLEQADVMIDACQKAKVKLQIGHHMRSTPHFIDGKKAIEDGVIGDVNVVRAAWVVRLPDELPPGDLSKAPVFWRLSEKVAGHGALFDMGTHLLDLSMWYCGEPTSVYGTTTKRLPVEDTANVFITFRSGAVGFIECSYKTAPVRIEAVVAGTDGTFWASDTPHTVPFRIYSKDTAPNIMESYTQFYVRQREAAPFKTGYQGETESFMKCIREDLEPVDSGKDGRKALECIFATLRSVQTEQVVKLPLK